MRHLHWVAKKWLLPLVILATLLGGTIDSLLGNQIDYWVHDAALVYQERRAWKYTAIVVLDDAIPTHVGRKQALPLFARAVEKLMSAGVKGIFLDAELSKENEELMPYAVCIERDGEVRWSEPTCLQRKNQCQLLRSRAGDAPLKMRDDVFPFFRVAPYLPGQENLPEFVLYGVDAEAFIPKTGLVAQDRLIGKNSAIARWMDLSEEHAVITLAKFINAEQVNHSLAHEDMEVCDQNLPCRRIRFSRPVRTTQLSKTKPIIPVSKLASCDANEAAQAAAMLKNRVVILQLTTPSEATDVIITPVTIALFGAHLLTPGPQYLADAVETLLMNDHPRAPHSLLKLLVFLIAACIGVYASIYLQQQSWLWIIGIIMLLGLCALCLFSPIIQLWPVTASILTFIAGALEGIALHLFIGFKEGRLIVQYMPQQVHSLLLSLKGNQTFRNQRSQAIVLMSDLTGYTTVTDLLKEPTHILELMNDYLNETSYILQEQHEGWLETYIGDMVCYYWPFKAENQTLAYQNAVKGALALSLLQKRFFSELSVRYQKKFDPPVLQSIQQVINAGIGLSAGSVVMGDLGPKRGVRKFGILGDPMNLTSRIEGLTRYFNTEIIMTDAFLNTAKTLGYPTRHLGCFRVKGREQAVMLYALGAPDDPRFQKHTIDAWEAWLHTQEHAQVNPPHCPPVFQLDETSLRKWQARGLLQKGIWMLEDK